mgnify:CR=1 FL=1
MGRHCGPLFLGKNKVGLNESMCFSGTGVAKGFTLACVGVWEVKVGVKGGGRAECVCVSVESRRTGENSFWSRGVLVFYIRLRVGVAVA